MKEKTFNVFIIIISLFTLCQLIIKKSIIYSSIVYALNLWVNSLIPSLFPFFIISDILINYNITSYIPKIISILCKKIFNINDGMLTILLLSMISGFPSNARNTRMLYDRKIINLEEANHILMFTHFANPIFIFTTVGVFFLHNEKYGIILLISSYLSNIILGICIRKKIICNNNFSINYIKDNFGNIFINAIRRAIDTILIICGIVIVFSMFSSIIINTFHLSDYNTMLIKGFFEITIGIEELSRLSLNNTFKMVITSMFLAFGGVSVHIQVLSQIADTNIKYIYFFIGRMYQMIISGIITYIICILMRI